MKSLTVPVVIVQYAFQYKLIPQLRLWLYFKDRFPVGYFKYSSSLGRTSMEELGIKCLRTLNLHIRKLQSWNWLGYDFDCGCYFIRSYSRIQTIANNNSRLNARFYPENFSNFRVWCASVVIGSLLIWSKLLRRSRSIERGKQERINAGSNPSLPLSNSLIAKALGVSIKQASIYKNRAVNAGYIKIERHQYSIIHVSPSDLKILRNLDPLLARKLQIRGTNVYERLPDRLFIGILEFIYRRRNLKQKK